jgi:hypothetical protein
VNPGQAGALFRRRRQIPQDVGKHADTTLGLHRIIGGDAADCPPDLLRGGVKFPAVRLYPGPQGQRPDAPRKGGQAAGWNKFFQDAGPGIHQYLYPAVRNNMPQVPQPQEFREAPEAEFHDNHLARLRPFQGRLKVVGPAEAQEDKKILLVEGGDEPLSLPPGIDKGVQGPPRPGRLSLPPGHDRDRIAIPGLRKAVAGRGGKMGADSGKPAREFPVPQAEGLEITLKDR